MSWKITPELKVPIDPFRSNVSLLLHGDGVNGSQTIIDSSPTPKTVTAFGNAQISTAQSRFGGSSMFFDGAGPDTVNGSALKVSGSDSGAFGTSDFTIEAWILVASFTTYGTIAATRLGGASQATQWSLTIANDGTRVQAIGLYSNGFFALSGNNVISQNTWHHVVVARAGSALRTFVDGAIVGTSTNTQNFAPALLSIGASHRGNGNMVEPLNGYIDELRITNGIARYQSSFTPPTAPFPDI